MCTLLPQTRQEKEMLVLMTRVLSLFTEDQVSLFSIPSAHYLIQHDSEDTFSESSDEHWGWKKERPGLL